jgi:hypothetical protein
VFGTRALDVLEKIDELGQPGLTVLIYASRAEAPTPPYATWAARYVGWQPAVGNGLVPRNWRHFRPPSTAQEDREAGWWYAFYQVDDLHKLDEPVPIGILRSDRDNRRLSEVFVPEGPLLVRR